MNNGKKYYLKYVLLDKRKVGKNGKKMATSIQAKAQSFSTTPM